MTEPIPSPIDVLQPGDAVHFADLTELVAFEDCIAQKVDPNYAVYAWNARPHIRNFIRPPKFNGTIADIVLTVMDNPYQRLLSVGTRGYKSSGFGDDIRRLGEAHEAAYAPRYVGFQFLGNAKSTGRGTIGQIQTEMYYYPFTPNITPAGKVRTKKQTLKSGIVANYVTVSRKDLIEQSRRIVGEGLAIGRVILKPKLETSQFIQLDENARQIGFTTLLDSLIRPFGGMHE